MHRLYSQTDFTESRRMPKCLLNAIRGYKSGEYCAVHESAVRRSRRQVSSPDINTVNDVHISSGRLKCISSKKQSVNHLSLVTRFYLSNQISLRHGSCRKEMSTFMTKAAGGNFSRGGLASNRPLQSVRSLKRTSSTQYAEAANRRSRHRSVARSLSRPCTWKKAQKTGSGRQKLPKNSAERCTSNIQLENDLPVYPNVSHHAYSSIRTKDRLPNDFDPLFQHTSPSFCSVLAEDESSHALQVPPTFTQTLFMAQFRHLSKVETPERLTENWIHSRPKTPFLQVHSNQRWDHRQQSCMFPQGWSTRNTSVPFAVFQPVIIASHLALSTCDGNADTCCTTDPNSNTMHTSHSSVRNPVFVSYNKSAWVSSLAASISSQHFVLTHNSLVPVLVMLPQLSRSQCSSCLETTCSSTVPKGESCMTVENCDGKRQCVIMTSDRPKIHDDKVLVGLDADDSGASRSNRNRGKEIGSPLSERNSSSSRKISISSTLTSRGFIETKSKYVGAFDFSSSGISDGAPSFKCGECNAEFGAAADYNSHLLSHKGSATDGVSRNKCGVCSRVFTRSWLLKGHMRTHTGERPFHCSFPHCNKAFADKSNLRSHTLIHTTLSKSFSCPKCARAFSQKRYLHKHMLEVCRII